MVLDVSVSNSGAASLAELKCTVRTTVDVSDHALAFCRATYYGHAETWYVINLISGEAAQQVEAWDVKIEMIRV